MVAVLELRMLNIFLQVLVVVATQVYFQMLHIHKEMLKLLLEVVVEMEMRPLLVLVAVMLLTEQVGHFQVLMEVKHHH